jgi:hypothetical protein
MSIDRRFQKMGSCGKQGPIFSSIMQYSSIFAKKQSGQPTEDEIIDEKYHVSKNQQKHNPD